VYEPELHKRRGVVLSNPVILHHGIVRDGKFHAENIQVFKGAFSGLEGKRVTVTVKKYHKDRSSNQNKYYWSVVLGVFGEYLGYTTEELHEAMKMKFLLVHSDGKPDTVRSTTELNTVEMEAYLESIRQFAAIYGVSIPLPNEIQ